MGNGEGLFNEDKLFYFYFWRHEEHVLDLEKGIGWKLVQVTWIVHIKMIDFINYNAEEYEKDYMCVNHFIVHGN